MFFATYNDINRYWKDIVNFVFRFI
jgi:hypothetical protein